MAYKISLIPGDGIGPEVSNAARRCVDATGVKIDWEIVEAGADVVEKYGTPLPASTLESIKRNKVALKGPLTTPIGTGFRSVNVAIRKELDLYTCLRPCKSFKGVRSKFRDIDLVVVRENTEDLYAGIEFEEGKPETKKLIKEIEDLSGKKIRSDSGISIKPISISGTKRIAKFAFEYAVKHNRKKVTAITKANIMKFTDGLFYAASREVAKEYEGRIEYDERLIDNMCMQLVQKPELYDVLLLPNLYGDIISDLCAGLIGGLGIAPGANLGNGIAVFEAIHGSAPKYAGKNVVNPTAMILSAVLMLDYLGENDAARRLEKAVERVISEGRSVTYDLKENRSDPSSVSTSKMADAIISSLT